MLIPNENRDASYAQLYIYDSQMALNQRMNRNQSLDRDTMCHLQDMLLEHDPFVPLYKQAPGRLNVRVLLEFPLLVPFIVLLPLSVSALAY